MLKIRFLLLVLILIFSSCDKAPTIGEAVEETFYIRNGGSDMPAFVRGNIASKTFVIYLQGGPGKGSLVDFYPFAVDLYQDYALVFWDQRHTGNSHGHYDEDEMTVDLVVEDLFILIQTIKIRYGDDSSIFLMGSSWGGLFALSYLIEGNHQDEIMGWISIAGAKSFDRYQDLNNWVISIGNEEIAANKNVEEWTEILDFFNSFDSVDDLSFEDDTKRNSYIKQIDDKLINQYLNVIPSSTTLPLYSEHVNDNFVDEFNWIYYPSSFREEVTKLNYNENQMSRITSPALLIYGKYDNVVPQIQGQRIYSEILSPSKEFILYEKSAHGPMLTEPNRFVEDVSKFIEMHK